MITGPINAVPVQGRLNVIQAGIFNLNMRLVALARQQLAIVNRDNSLFAAPEGPFDEDSTFQSKGTHFNFGNSKDLTPAEREVRDATNDGASQFGQHIDGASTLSERDRAIEGSAAVTTEQGHETPPSPLITAEIFVSMRDMLMLKYFDECNKARRKPLDQSFAAVITWMHDREFIPNQPEAQAVFMASKGRVSLEQALIAQKRRHEDERKRLAKIAEPLLKTMEDFSGRNLEELLNTDTPTQVDGDIVIDTVFENLPALVRLGLVNVMWRRCNKLVQDDFPSKKVPTQDFAADIALAIAAQDEFLELAKKLYKDAEDEYRARQTSGLPDYDVIRVIDAERKSAAQKAAAATGPLAQPARAAA